MVFGEVGIVVSGKFALVYGKQKRREKRAELYGKPSGNTLERRYRLQQVVRGLRKFESQHPVSSPDIARKHY